MITDHIHICKFGGSTLTSLSDINHHAKRIVEMSQPVIVVVSAMKGQTDAMTSQANQLTKNVHAREMAALTVTGEQQTAALMAMALIEHGREAQSLSAWQCGLKASGHFLNAVPESLHVDKLKSLLKKNIIPVVTGFQAIDNDSYATLGRGGSDTTAVFIAAQLGVRSCTFYKDVHGLYLADPNLLPCPAVQPEVSYHEMLEAAALGAKIIERQAVLYAMRHLIAIHIKHAFIEGDGTMLREKSRQMGIQCIAHSEHQHLIMIVSEDLDAGKNYLQKLTECCASPRLLQYRLEDNKYSWLIACQMKSKLPDFTGQGHTEVRSGLVAVSVVGWNLRSSPCLVNEYLQLLMSQGIRVQEHILAEISMTMWLPQVQCCQTVKILSDCIIQHA